MSWADSLFGEAIAQLEWGERMGQARSVADSAITKASWRILPLLGLGYLCSYLDRLNVSFAATQMNVDLGFSATVYGLGGGFFFLTYALLEIPSGMVMPRYGARRWIVRIMVLPRCPQRATVSIMLREFPQINRD